MSNDNTQGDAKPSPASAGSAGSDLYGGGFNRWLASIGKTREEATDADDIQWLKLDRHRLNMLWRWIPVTERLPDEGGVFPCVLAKIGGMHYPAIARRSESTTGWVELGGMRLFAAWEITHWMPLPAPPSDDK
jgi:hypothetical protein